jgi:hypothetical protein
MFVRVTCKVSTVGYYRTGSEGRKYDSMCLEQRADQVLLSPSITQEFLVATL